MFTKIKEWDQKISDKIVSKRNQYLDKVMVMVTRLGDSGLIWVMIAIIFLVTKHYRFVALKILLSLCLTTIFGEVIIKKFVARLRPFQVVSKNDLLIKKPKSYSFPSGHTSSSFSVAVILSEVFPLTTIPVFLLASLIGFSRIYLRVHYPTDVIFGSIIGIICGVITEMIISL